MIMAVMLSVTDNDFLSDLRLDHLLLDFSPEESKIHQSITAANYLFLSVIQTSFWTSCMHTGRFLQCFDIFVWMRQRTFGT